MTRVKLMGVFASPYTRKMVSLMRYRRIPYSLTWGDPSRETYDLPKPKVALLPTFYFEDEQGEIEAVVDSTPIIRRLERDFPGRSVIPNNDSLAFLDYLIEDFGDEWCTKFMFHYRWDKAEDIDHAGTMLPLWNDHTITDAAQQQIKTQFSQHQISRLGVVGSNDITRPIIEISYKRLLDIFERHFQQYPFLLGNRPGAGDYGVYGQFSQLIGVDPTPTAIARQRSPRSCAWVNCLDDLSGLETSQEDWLDPNNLPETFIEILQEIGKTYVPALLANAKALSAGESQWQTEIDGKTWQQNSFPYQAKCLHSLRQHFQALTDTDQENVEKILTIANCDKLLQALR